MKKIIPLLVFCLVATCKAELRTWTAANGKEVEAEFVSNEKGIVKLKLKSGKVFEVPANKLSKEDNEFISSLAKPEGVNYDELEFRDTSFSVAYFKGSLYTGKSFMLYENGQKQLEANYKDGKRDGLQTNWHKNGQKKSEANYKDGKRDGLYVTWHDNGQKSSEKNRKDGKQDGLAAEWYENGKKKLEVNYKDGKIDGLYVTWYFGGEKWIESTSKNGKKEGLETKWHTNGKKYTEVNFKNGKKEGLETKWHTNGKKYTEGNYKDGEVVEGSKKKWNFKGEPFDSKNTPR